ncbi:MAG: FAD-binding oxidoreductase [Gemmatimonadota bacterium]
MQRLFSEALTRVAGAGLNHLSRPLTFPAAFQGTVFQGEEAARRASLVSGPFSASPAAYVIPSGVEGLATLVRWSWSEGIPLIPRGGGTGMPGGNLGPFIVVEMDGIGRAAAMLSPEEGRIQADAGAIASDVERLARTHGRFLPFLPSSARWCQMGGIVANNGAGARSFRYGSVAASLLRIEGFFAWGEPFQVGADLPVPDEFRRIEDGLRENQGAALPGWPKLRKNSSGYALDRYLAAGDPAQLLAGSEGTLAIITRVELRALPLPPARGLAVLAAGSSEELTRIALGAEALGTVTCEFLGRRFLEMADVGSDPEVGALAEGAYALVLLETCGSEEEVEAGLAGALRLGESAGRGAVVAREPDTVARLWGLRHAAGPMIAREAGRGRISTQFIEDSVVPPERLGAYLDGLDEILAAHRFDALVFGHAGDGNVHVNPLVDVGSSDWEARVRGTLDEVVELVASLGGTLSGEHGDGRLRAPFLSQIWAPPLVEAFRRVKDALDPRGILNPGVVIPRAGQDPLEGLTPRPRSYPI